MISLLQLQEYDPDLPPELAAATGIHDTSNENAVFLKVQGEVGESAKVSERVRPPLVYFTLLLFFCSDNGYILVVIYSVCISQLAEPYKWKLAVENAFPLLILDHHGFVIQMQLLR